MDEMMDFFDLSKGFERKPAPVGCVTGSVKALSLEPIDSKPKKRQKENDGTEYADELTRQEKRKMNEFFAPQHGRANRLDSLEVFDDNDDNSSSSVIKDFDDNSQEDARFDDDFYDRYPFDLKRDDTLPIYQRKDKIIKAINENPVVILEGNTGCGKTTQVPQYILDDACVKRQHCSIVCTQPRRIAAITIANRVCAERKWSPKTVCSYKVGLHQSVSQDTRLLYCTTGLLLQKLVYEKSLTNFTHIILDEVHERNQEMDFLLIIIRRLLIENSRQVKIILMSATIDTTQFANYFSICNQPAPVLRVDSHRNYCVREYYTNDLGRINACPIEVTLSEPGISQDMYNAVVRLILVLEHIEQRDEEQRESKDKVSILIFLPGLNEIITLHDKIAAICNPQEQDDVKVNLFPVRLHSLISPDEQLLAFHQAPRGYRKVILATNIAESSITVPDVKYVIDFCLTKVMICDSNTNFSSLQLCWASRANCRQRAGRAGRVMNGRVYRMVPKQFYESLDEFSIPEMLRCPLERVVLKSKLLNMGPPCNILGLAMNPPNKSDIRNTILLLKEVGALYTTVDGVGSCEDGDLTYWGRIMDTMPLDVRLTRLIIIGYTFGCLRDVIVIAAGLNVRSLFLLPDKAAKRSSYDAFTQKLVWADGSGSDLLSIWRAYMTYRNMCLNSHIGTSVNDWARRYHLNILGLREMDLLINELNKRLDSFNIKDIGGPGSNVWLDCEKTTVMKIIFAGAFYPNYFLRDKAKTVERQRTIFHTLAGRDPCNTVYFTNFKVQSMGELYTRNIKELFADMRIPRQNIDVTFQPGSEKVFVTFKNLNGNSTRSSDRTIRVPGQINPNIVKAVRMRKETARPSIYVMDTRNAMQYVNQNNIGAIIDGVWYPTTKSSKHAEIVCLPSVFDKKLRGYISHVETCSKFYFQPLKEMTTINQFKEMLNDPNEIRNNRFNAASDITKGMILSALNGKYYKRAVVLDIIINGSQPPKFKVRFIDYGDTAITELNELRYFSRHTKVMKDYPPRMFECRLALVHPSLMSSAHNCWNSASNEALYKISQAGVIEIEIYSLVSHVAHVMIRLNDADFGERLIHLNYARKADEDYMSKSDHDLRLRKQTLMRNNTMEWQRAYNEEYLRNLQQPIDYDIEPPPRNRCFKSIILRGPFSPLETEMFSTLRISNRSSVNIDRESVNDILLDSDPQDSHDSMIVAASVTQNPQSGTLTARNTSVMPNVHGFAALMIMIFSPKVQLKCNNDRTKYISLLAGLGYDKHTKKSLYEEHDIILNLDVDILKEDIKLINKIRYMFDTMYHTTTAEDLVTITKSDHVTITGNIKQEIVRLLNKSRHFIEPHYYMDDFQWDDNLSDVQTVVDCFGSRTLFPMIDSPCLYEEKFDRLHTLNEHCKEMHELSYFDGSFQPIKCQLCNHELQNINELRIHLLSQIHRDREQQIGFKARS